MTTLYVLADYSSKKENYKAGDVIEVSPQKALWLKTDSPGTFSRSAPVVEKPPKDKAIKSRTVRKKAPTK